MKKDKYELITDLCNEINSMVTPPVIYEFGVAFGETTLQIESMVNSEVVYLGFDTFTGLPNAWRGLPKGAISAGGQIPTTTNPKFTFHKGLIQETISEIDFDSIATKILILDFDLFEPTLLVVESFSRYLRCGDILYFDELFAADERLIFENYIEAQFEFEILFATVFGLALKILKHK